MFHFLTPIRTRIFLMVGTVSIVGIVYMTARVALLGQQEIEEKPERGESAHFPGTAQKSFWFFLSKNLKTECLYP